MSRSPSRDERRASSLAFALAKVNAPEQDTAPDARTVVAMWAALCGAQVTVTHGGGNSYGNGYRVGCEACGELHDMSWSDDEIPNSYAQKHAATCRRVPERLWPDGGAR